MSRYRAGQVAGALVALVIFCVGSVVVFERIQRSRRAALEGLMPEAALFAGVDVAEDTQVKNEVLMQRSVARGGFKDQLIDPNDAWRVTNSRVHKALRAGDPILQSDIRVGYGEEEVMFAARDIAPGTLNEADVVVRALPKRWLSPSWVHASEKGVFFRKVVARINKGDPLLWSHFNENEDVFDE